MHQGELPEANSRENRVHTIILTPAFRRLRRALTREPGFAVLQCSDSLEEALAFCSRLRPCLVILPEETVLNANPEEFRWAIDFGRTVKVLVQVRRDDPVVVETLLRLGCAGCLNVDMSPTRVRQAVEAVTAGEIWASRKVLSSLLQSFLAVDDIGLTPRETEIMRLIGSGLKNQEIAHQLFISLETVRWHIRCIYNKIGIHDRSHAAEYARNHVVHGQHSHKVVSVSSAGVGARRNSA